uniref:Ovule protein n=1 Tax=Steinernema glaseri TaxID=37863 RepID=A0A1I8AM19_9BILA
MPSVFNLAANKNETSMVHETRRCQGLHVTSSSNKCTQHYQTKCMIKQGSKPVTTINREYIDDKHKKRREVS